jgi:hypothetical protein
MPDSLVKRGQREVRLDGSINIARIDSTNEESCARNEIS